MTAETDRLLPRREGRRPLRRRRLRRSFQKLWDSGLFEDLRIEKEAAEGGVRLVAVVVERPRVDDLEFRGNKKLTTSQLKDKLKEGKVEIRVGRAALPRDVSQGQGPSSSKPTAPRGSGRRVGRLPPSSRWRRTSAASSSSSTKGDKIKIESIELHRQHRRLGAPPAQRDEEDEVAELLPVLGLEGRLQPGELRGGRRVDQDGLPERRATRTSSSRTRCIEIFVVNPNETADKVKRRARIRFPIVEGDRYYFGDLKIDGQRQPTSRPATVSRRPSAEQFLDRRRAAAQPRRPRRRDEDARRDLPGRAATSTPS